MKRDLVLTSVALGAGAGPHFRNPAVAWLSERSRGCRARPTRRIGSELELPVEKTR